jgi:predicted MFS family arabinose efflux permease
VCLFAAQAGLIALSPVLSAVAADFDVSTAAAGQLRLALGLAAGVTALAAGRLGARFSLRALLVAGAAILAFASVASAAAPSLVLLALAQIGVGVGVALLGSAAIAAAAEWVPADQRARVLSRALTGAPVAWIVGMPLLGTLGDASWRYGWLALPLAAALAAAAAVGVRGRGAGSAPAAQPLREVLRERSVVGWSASELLASSGWAAVLIYAGALCMDEHGASGPVTGVVLAAGAAAFAVGNLTFRRLAGRDLRASVVGLSLALALAVMLLGAVSPTLGATAVIFAAAAFVAGGRVLLGNLYGLDLAPGRRLPVSGLRAAANQFGYFAGTAVAGGALALHGWSGFGVAAGLLIALAPLPLIVGSQDPRGSRRKLALSPG